MGIRLNNNERVQVWVSGDIPRGALRLIEILWENWYETSPVAAWLYMCESAESIEVTADPRDTIKATTEMLSHLPEPEVWIVADEVLQELVDAIADDTDDGFIVGWHPDDPGTFIVTRDDAEVWE